MQHQEVFAKLRKCTGMFVPGQTYAEVVAFVLGYDYACEGGVLVGFREWLAVRLGSGFNLFWSALVLDVTFPSATSPQDAVHADPAAERRAIDTLFDLLDEFDKARYRRDGLQNIFLAYQESYARHLNEGADPDA